MRSLVVCALFLWLGLTTYSRAQETKFINDSRCNESVVDGIKFLQNVNNTWQYVECVTVGEAIWHDCVAETLIDFPWLNCTVATLNTTTSELVQIPVETSDVMENVTVPTTTTTTTAKTTTSTEAQVVDNATLAMPRLVDNVVMINLTETESMGNLFNDSRCDEAVLNTTKFLNHLTDVTKYVECVVIGVGKVHECVANGAWLNFSL